MKKQSPHKQIKALDAEISRLQNSLPKLDLKEFETTCERINLLEIKRVQLLNPIEFEAKLNYLFYITKGFKDFSKIATSQKTKAVKELDDFVKGNTFVPKGSGIGNNFDYTPEPLKGGFDASIIENIR